ncbi:MAG TPA: esterase-like activity of phytase family protein [Allosphingosinicella sp.]|nr:esterase-like activity of phytase family protein [Allosphingosinicella sp.]
MNRLLTDPATNLEGVHRRRGGCRAAVRAPFLLAAFVLLATFAPPALQHREPPPAVTLVRFTPVALDEKAPGLDRLGRLRFLGAWALTSNDARIGGISALHVEGGEALAMSDAGWRIRLPLPQGRAPARAEVAMLEKGPGPPGDKEDRDIESLVVHGEMAWIGYEQANAIWRYERRRFAPRASAAPRAMREWSDNAGPEAMARLADGRFLVFAEGQGGDSEAILFSGDPAAAGTSALRLRYRPPTGFRITDAATLPDGRLVLLNRAVGLFAGFTARLTVAALPLRADRALIVGREIAAFEGSVTRDNLEALSVVREGGRTILWIASDDNYNPLQRTLLMKFALVQ